MINYVSILGRFNAIVSSISLKAFMKEKITGNSLMKLVSRASPQGGPAGGHAYTLSWRPAPTTGMNMRRRY
jgi:hypothetical protein